MRPFVKPDTVEPPPASDWMHRRVADALERGVQAQQQSRRLREHQRALDAALQATLATIDARRRLDAERRSAKARC